MNSYEEEKITFLIDDLLAAIRQVDADITKLKKDQKKSDEIFLSHEVRF